MSERTHDEILADIDKDSKIDETNLSGELTRIPYLHAKWMKTYIGLNKALRKAERIHASVKLERSNYHQGLAGEAAYKEFPLNRKVLKSELPEILAADPPVCRAKEAMDELADITMAVEKFISSLNNRGFNLGKAVDYVRWKNGG